MINENNDKELYQDFLIGKQESFNILVKRYRNQLVYFINNYINDREASEDIAQDVFIYIFITKKKYDFNCTFKTYLYTIARSRVINYCKNKKSFLELDENIQSDFPDIDDILINKEEKEDLLRKINALKSEYKTVIFLRELEGLSYEEISLIMGKSLSQIKMLLYRARKELKNKMNKSKVITKVIINTMLIIVCLVGVTYAGITIYKFIQKEATTDFKNNPEYDDYSEDMIYNNEIYHKTILDYETYIKDKNKWPEIIEMTKEDFEEYFVVIIAGENYNTTGLYISDISTDENNIYINLNKKDIWDGSTVISAKIEKELYRDNMIVKNNPNIPQAVDNFTKIEDIPVGYTKEDALKDGLFVIEANRIISSEKERFEKFIENANNGIDDYIRIYDCDLLQNIMIIDIECKNGKINMSQSNKTQEGNQTIYNSGNEIIRSNGIGIYWLKDEIGNKKAICSIDI